MEQAFEELGEWWLPDRPEHRLCGTLTFVPSEGLTLRLLGCLVDDPTPNADDRYPIIHGRAAGVGDVTLLGCWQSTYFPFGTRLARPPAVTDYRASTALLGAHCSSDDELRFRKIWVRFEHLLEWINPRGIRGTGNRTSDGSWVSTVIYHHPQDIRATTGPVDVVLRDDGTTSQSWYRAEIAQSYVAVLEAQEPWRVREWRARIVGPLEDLLTFATEAPSTTTEFAVSLLGTDPARRARVVANTRDPRQPTKALFPHDMLFTYGDVASRFEEVLTTWVGLYDSLGTVIRLLLGILHHRSRFFSTEAELLTAVQAVESYHRARRTSNKSKTLGQRLGDLIREASLAVDPLLSSQNVSIQQIVDARNFLSHLNPSDRTKRLAPLSLIDARDILVVLLQTLLLRELGFTEQEAFEKVRSTSRYRTIGQRKAVGLEPGDDGMDW